MELLPFWVAYGLAKPEDLPDAPAVDESELQAFYFREPQPDETRRKVAYCLTHYRIWRDALARLPANDALGPGRPTLSG